ncbi:hypothetical protein SRB5_30680 [Streptomyces sp. RB5]|uniref:YncI copper-binding domain-containing protein n=1 Tax=Streptomyces smaragdinus TaxID=2585196 RepID=A0A7K0CHG4_9ACTN|nr:YcnI family protein [Streptomyces smaragdinus]MQY12929.1 hypothetical protein [Streptomyces smaragdinus]
MTEYALRRAAVAALSTGLVLLAGSGPAAAHVGVTPESAAPGGYSKLTFRVPDERPDSATVRVEIALPEKQPVASVSVKPLPGWTVTTRRRELSTPLKAHGGEITDAVSRIVWSGGEIRPGQFQEFEVSLGPLPEAGDSMVFKALQTYDDGEVVRWIDLPAADGGKPERPAPVLRLAGPATASAAPKETAAVTAPAAGDDGTARFLGVAALAVALGGAALSLVTRGRRS